MNVSRRRLTWVDEFVIAVADDISVASKQQVDSIPDQLLACLGCK